MSWVKDALLSVVMSKEARDKLRDYQDAKRNMAERGIQPHPMPAPPEPELTAAEALEKAAAAMEERKAKITPEREALIRNAMAVHRTQQKVLSELSEEERDHLTAMALKAIQGRK